MDTAEKKQIKEDIKWMKKKKKKTEWRGSLLNKEG